MLNVAGRSLSRDAANVDTVYHNSRCLSTQQLRIRESTDLASLAHIRFACTCPASHFQVAAMELKIKATSIAMLAMILLACCAATGAAAQGDSSPSRRALKTVTGVNLVTSAGQLAGLDEEGLKSAVFSYRQMPDGWDKTGRKLAAAQQSPCLGCDDGKQCTVWPWVCCKRGGDGQMCCTMGSISGDTIAC